MLGFHLEGLVVTALIMMPNLLFLAFPPRNPPKEDPTSNLKAFELLERIGQVGSSVLPILFGLYFTGLGGSIALVGMVVSLLFYYVCWTRYFIMNRKYTLLFSPFLKIPVPMAYSPIIYLGFAALAMHSWLMVAAVVLLAIGHLKICYQAWRNFI